MQIYADNIYKENQYNGNNQVVTDKHVINANTSPLVSLSDLLQGQFFKGMITDVRNNGLVQIMLADNELVNATLSGKMTLNIGEKVIFQVKEHTPDRLVISPTSYGDGSNEIISKALLQAGLPESDKNIVLVKELMNFNQRVDKDTIINLLKQTRDYPNASVSSLVEMDAHDMPLSDENINQFENYKNLEYKLTDGLNNISDSITTMLSENISSQETSVAGNTELFQNIMNVIVDEAETQNRPIFNQVIGDDGVVINEAEHNANSNDANIVSEHENISTNTNTNIEIPDTETAKDTEKSFVETAKQMIIDAKTPEDIRNVTTYINENISSKAELTEVFNSPAVADNIKERITKKFMINPEIFTDENVNPKEKIDKLYSKLIDLSEHLEKALDANPKGSDNLSSGNRNLSQNLNFMSDLNNLSSFVQIPVKFSNSEANAELYVYNKNRGKVNDNDTLTAFLHLDMESLGATDVNVSLTQNHVTVRFSLEDSASARLIDKHLDELVKKLESKGYFAECKSEVIKKEEESPVTNIFEHDESAISIKRYLFDIRA